MLDVCAMVSHVRIAHGLGQYPEAKPKYQILYVYV